MTGHQPLRVALVGFGLGGATFHAPFVIATPGLQLAAVVTRDPQRRAHAHRLAPGARLLADADEVWRHAGDYDLAVVSTPTGSHVALATAALESGLPVVVDKPVGSTQAEVATLAALAERHGVALVPFHNRRWDADYRTLQHLRDAGDLGEIARFESRFERWRPRLKGGWREQAPREQGGGVLMDLGPHLVDQALQLLGPARTVYAELDARRSGVAGDDDAFVALTHASGARSHLWANAVAADLGPRFRVLGARAAFVKSGLDPQEAALREGELPGGPGWGEEPAEAWGVLEAGEQARPVRSIPGDYGAFYRGIVAMLRDGAAAPVPAADAVQVAHVLDAAVRSAEHGQVVALG